MGRTQWSANKLPYFVFPLQISDYLVTTQLLSYLPVRVLIR